MATRLIATVVALVLVGPHAGASARTQAVPAEPWQTDFKAFVTAVQNCVATRCALAAFADREVAWEGTVLNWHAKDKRLQLAMGSGTAPSLSLPAPAQVVCCAFILNEAPAAAVTTKGATVRFQATMSSWMPLLMNAGRVLVSLEHERIVEDTSPLALRPRVTVSGRIVDEKNAVVADAKVQVSFPGVPAFATTTRSGADGGFQLLLPLGAENQSSLTLIASNAGEGLLASKASLFGVAGNVAIANQTTLVMRPGGTVDILVKDQRGRAVKDLEVSVVSVDGHHVSSIGHSMTPGTGLVTLQVPAGRVTIAATQWKDDVARMRGETAVEVEPGSKSKVEIVVSPVPAR
jgi:hypothetical protein